LTLVASVNCRFRIRFRIKKSSEVLGAAINLPYRTSAQLVGLRVAAGGDCPGYRHESPLTIGGSSSSILFWHLPGPTRRCADRTRSPVRGGLTNPTEDRSPPVPPPLPPPTAVARAPGRCVVAGWTPRCGRGYLSIANSPSRNASTYPCLKWQFRLNSSVVQFGFRHRHQSTGPNT
jgi:hypothetical protein